MGNTILLADDAASMRAMLRDILTKAGYSVVAEAVNGRDAVDEYERLAPDLVILDITMPQMDGLTTLKEIRRINPDARCVMCSATGQQAVVLEALKAGAADFITKPFIANKAIEAVDNALRN